MCGDPITLGLAVLGTVVNYNQVSAQTNAQQAMYNAQAEADEQNAKIQERRNDQVADAYAQQQQKLDAKMRLARGKAAAEFGANNLSLDAGSGLDILSSIDDAYKQDSMTLLTNQRNDNYEGRMQRANFKHSAASNRTAATNIGIQGNLAKMGTILGGISSMYGISRNGSSSGGSGSEGAIYKPNPYSGSKNELEYFNKTRKNMGGFFLGAGRL